MSVTTSPQAEKTRIAPVDFARIGEELAEAMTLEETAKAVRATRSTVVRWTLQGVRTRDGRTHKLPTVAVGLRKFVRPADLAGFLEGLNSPQA